jgi:hypothetical protein
MDNTKNCVHFASPLRLPSPKVKASPVLDSYSLKFGEFLSPVQENSLPSTSACLVQDHVVVPLAKVFGSLKNHL